jgi:hypothetical protein
LHPSDLANRPKSNSLAGKWEKDRLAKVIVIYIN